MTNTAMTQVNAVEMLARLTAGELREVWGALAAAAKREGLNPAALRSDVVDHLEGYDCLPRTHPAFPVYAVREFAIAISRALSVPRRTGRMVRETGFGGDSAIVPEVLFDRSRGDAAVRSVLAWW